MKKLTILAVAAMLALCGCVEKQPETAQESTLQPSVESSVDGHGCIGSAGQSYSLIKNSCVQVFDIADISLDDPDNKALAVYGIFDKKKDKVEIFWASLGNKSEILSKKGKKFISQDGGIWLEKSGKTYKIYKEK